VLAWGGLSISYSASDEECRGGLAHTPVAVGSLATGVQCGAAALGYISANATGTAESRDHCVPSGVDCGIDWTPESVCGLGELRGRLHVTVGATASLSSAAIRTLGRGDSSDVGAAH